jgi:type III pantothenate kinase
VILLIDAGNSRIKWACLVGGVIQAGEPVSQGDPSATIAALRLAWAPLPRPERVVAVSVAGSGFAAALTSLITKTWDLPIEFVSARRRCGGVTNGYRVPEQLGADRWVGLIAARRITRSAACVIDCGTAVTIDSLTSDGSHLGGLILPGLRVIEQALIERTSGIRPPPDQLGLIALSPYGRDTGEGVRNGAFYAIVAAIDRVVRELRKDQGKGLRCFLTGGDAGRLLPFLAGRFDHQPELVLRGLAVVAEERP